MREILKINCKRVYEASVNFNLYKDEIVEIEKNLKEILDRINLIWKGYDSLNFNNKFLSYINSLNGVNYFLSNRIELMKEKAFNHNIADENFITTMKRSDIDEKY